MPIKSYHLRSLKSYVSLSFHLAGGFRALITTGAGRGVGGKSDEMARVTVNSSNVHTYEALAGNNDMIAFDSG